jgi:hypothetical protein
MDEQTLLRRKIAACKWWLEDSKWRGKPNDRRKIDRRSTEHKPRGSEDARKHPAGSRRVSDWVKLVTA